MARESNRGESRNLEHRTVSRAMGILEAVISSEPQGLRLGDLSDEVKAPKSSIHGLAKGLVATGYLRENQGRYYAGPALELLAPGRLRLPPNAHRVLEELAVAADETAILAALIGDSVINVDYVASTQLIRASPVLNVRRPIWPTSYGKIFLAYMAAGPATSYIGRHFPAGALRDAVRTELADILESGIAFNRAESTPGLYGLAGPVRTEEGVLLAIGVAGPAERMKDREGELARAVAAAAADLSTTSAH